MAVKPKTRAASLSGVTFYPTADGMRRASGSFGGKLFDAVQVKRIKNKKTRWAVSGKWSNGERVRIAMGLDKLTEAQS